MLFINPHVSFFGLEQYYEAHLHSEQGWDILGLSRFALSFLTWGTMTFWVEPYR
jgi:hypothetical protein